MKKHKKRHSSRKTFALMSLGLLGLGLTIAMLLQGTDIKLFNPKGVIAEQQLNLIIFSVALLLTAAVPTLILLYAFAWKYRDTGDESSYDPEARHGRLLVFSIWAIPSVFMLALGLVMWPSTHKLEPKKTIESNVKPITIQVVAMRWKWLFIYPEHNIATVNYVQIPVGTSVQFDLSADEAPMSSFWVPHLGGQLYAMTGHVNRLNLMAEQPGEYPGSSAEINGRGFAGMKFTTKATTKAEFDEWVKEMKASSAPLDSDQYEKILKPSENAPIAFFSPVEADLYAKILMKYEGSHAHRTETHEGSEQ